MKIVKAVAISDTFEFYTPNTMDGYENIGQKSTQDEICTSEKLSRMPAEWTSKS